jgi:prepilin-type N-terminal cleavage/methylation domain-containing protein
MRKGFTLIEVLVILAIFVVLIALIFPALPFTFAEKQSIEAQVVRKYEVFHEGTTIPRLDIRRQGQQDVEIIQVLRCYQNDWKAATIFANIHEGQWYKIDLYGDTNEKWGRFPNVVSATVIPNPER